MRLRAIICEVLAREAYYCAAQSPHVIDIELFDKGLHRTPSELRAFLQERICAATSDRYDAVVLGCGLCGNSTAGLRACGVPVIVPRAHDCITLYLGSRAKYQAYFTAHPGTYYYTADYVERSDAKRSVALGATADSDLQAEYEQYVAKYGKENADYLMEVMGAWKAHYNRAAYIMIPVPNLPDYRASVQEEAARRAWSYEEIAGDLGLVWDLLFGHWDDERFLRVEPGEEIAPSYGEEVIVARAVPDDIRRLSASSS